MKQKRWDRAFRCPTQKTPVETAQSSPSVKVSVKPSVTVLKIVTASSDRVLAITREESYILTKKTGMCRPIPTLASIKNRLYLQGFWEFAGLSFTGIFTCLAARSMLVY
jgi:hypothetical protein